MDDITKIGLIGLAVGIAVIGFVLWRVYATASRREKRTGYSPSDSAAYQQFFNLYVNPAGNYDAWHDGLDGRIFEKMSATERERAEALLIETLPDWRAIQGLGYLRSQKAIEPLKKLHKSADKEQVVYIEQALSRIGGQGSNYGEKTRSVLLGDTSPSLQSARMDAAIALYEQPSAETADILLQSIKRDPEYLVRYQAVRSLLHIYGYTPDEVNTLMAELAPSLSNGSKGVAKPEAIQRVEALIANRKIGASA